MKLHEIIEMFEEWLGKMSPNAEIVTITRKTDYDRLKRIIRGYYYVVDYTERNDKGEVTQTSIRIKLYPEKRFFNHNGDDLFEKAKTQYAEDEAMQDWLQDFEDIWDYGEETEDEVPEEET